MTRGGGPSFDTAPPGPTQDEGWEKTLIPSSREEKTLILSSREEKTLILSSRPQGGVSKDRARSGRG